MKAGEYGHKNRAKRWPSPGALGGCVQPPELKILPVECSTPLAVSHNACRTCRAGKKLKNRAHNRKTWSECRKQCHCVNGRCHGGGGVLLGGGILACAGRVPCFNCTQRTCSNAAFLGFNGLALRKAKGIQPSSPAIHWEFLGLFLFLYFSCQLWQTDVPWVWIFPCGDDDCMWLE